MLKIFILFIMITHYSFSQNTNNLGKSYYFKMGKTNNEFRINNRIYFLNHNITDYDYTHKRVDHIYSQKVNENHKNNYSSNFFIDEEWDYKHQDLNKTELPLFIHKLYEKFTPDMKSTNRILFNVNRNSSTTIIKFNLESLKPNETVLDAEFYFFWPLESSSKIYRESVVLRLYQFERQFQDTLNQSTLIENPDIHKLFNVIYISKAQKGWQTFKIKKPIDNWLNGEDNLGLLLTISSYDDNKLISMFNDTNQGLYRSFAVITVQSNRSESVKHEIKEKDKDQGITSCQKKEWTVNFRNLHWDNFIIAPDGFIAYDCIGNCLNLQSNYITHVNLLHILKKRAPCCVPVDYLPLPIMFYDKLGNIVIKNYENMIVTECGCR